VQEWQQLLLVLMGLQGLQAALALWLQAKSFAPAQVIWKG
jgi:hypothetical protein